MLLDLASIYTNDCYFICIHKKLLFPLYPFRLTNNIYRTIYNEIILIFRVLSRFGHRAKYRSKSVLECESKTKRYLTEHESSRVLEYRRNDINDLKYHCISVIALLSLRGDVFTEAISSSPTLRYPHTRAPYSSYSSSTLLFILRAPFFLFFERT